MACSFFSPTWRSRGSNGTPPRIDRSFLGGSEGTKTQLLAALKYFGLIAANGTVNEELAELVRNPAERPNRIKNLLFQYYPDAIALGEQNATQAQLEEAFAGLQGSTRRKAVAFYLKAAEYGKIKLSPNFRNPRERGRPKGSKTRKPKDSGGSSPAAGDRQEPPIAPEEAQRARYVDLLMKRAESEDNLDTDLLDRLERLLGFSEAGDNGDTE